MTLKMQIEGLIREKDFIGVEWLDSAAVIVTLRTVTRASIDVCVQVLELMMKNWPQDQPFVALYDFPEVGLTPYLRQKMHEVREAKPDHLKCHLGVIIPNNSLGYIMYLYWHAYPQGDAMIEMQIFESRAAALEWISKTAE
ncbi:MAG: hypothetical protein K8I82_15840 [Anaerolineae bacterium]|nr:hypothetical protein [Anaerolineae bacterium]